MPAWPIPLIALSCLLLVSSTVALAQTSREVSIRDRRFDPDRTQVSSGGTVTWTHEGNEPHSVRALDGSFNSSPGCSALLTAACMGPGDTFEHTFTEPGMVRYRCDVHANMTGSVTVTAPPSPSPTPSPRPSPAATPSPTPTPEQEPEPEPEPSPTVPPDASPSPSPTTVAGAEPGDGLPASAIVAIVALIVSALSGAGLWWLNRRAR